MAETDEGASGGIASNGNVLTAGVAVLVFLLTFVALWAEQEWWWLVILLGYVILVPFVFFLVGEY